MLWLVRRLARLRGPAGVVALATGAGLLTGMVAAHAVLAAWTYRDASRRDLREPGRWALAVLVSGIVGFVPYVAVQRASGWRAVLPGGGRDDDDEDAADVGDDEDVAGAREDDEDVAGAREDDEDVAGAREDDEDAGGAREDGEGPGDDETVPAAGRERSPRAEVPDALPSAGRYGLKAARLGARGARWAGRRAAARMNNR
jgi:hypothetical protein